MSLNTNQIQVGSELPKGVLLKEDNPKEATVDIAATPGRVLIIGIPGAFTPTCSNQVPGYIQKESELFSRGINAVYVVAVNDAFVMKAWKKNLTGGAETKIRFLADDTGKFLNSLGLLFDATPVLGTPRSKRFAMVVKDGKVEHLAIEQEASDLSVTSVDAILQYLKSNA